MLSTDLDFLEDQDIYFSNVLATSFFFFLNNLQTHLYGSLKKMTLFLK